MKQQSVVFTFKFFWKKSTDAEGRIFMHQILRTGVGTASIFSIKKKKKNEMRLRQRLDPLPVRMVSHKRGQPKTLTLHADVNACLLKKINEAFSHNKRSPRAAMAELFPTAGHHTGKHNSNVGSR